jgi:hypothetical protein
MQRRAFIAGLGGAAAWSVCVRAQQSKELQTIGILMTGHVRRVSPRQVQ